MKKIKILLLICYTFFISCKKSTNDTGDFVDQINKEEVKNVKSKQQFEEVTISELNTFFNRLGNICKTNKNDISKQLSSNVLERYPEFCNMFDIVSTQREGEIQYDIIKNEGGVITINSIEVIEDDGDKYRNEYSTLLYIKKVNNELIISDIGGAG